MILFWLLVYALADAPSMNALWYLSSIASVLVTAYAIVATQDCKGD